MINHTWVPLQREEKCQVQVRKCIYKLKLVVWRSDLHQSSVDENVYALHHSTPAVELHPYRPENKCGQVRPGRLL